MSDAFASQSLSSMVALKHCLAFSLNFYIFSIDVSKTQ